MNVAISGLNHFAWRCRNAEETRHFYEEILGLPLVHVIKGDIVPSTGEYSPHVHIFFRMGDGSYVAFFDLGDGGVTMPDPDTPAWVNHLALQVPTMDDLLAARVRLEAHGIAVLGPTDHHIMTSIYFFDPNGLRLELTVRTASAAEMDQAAAEAHARLRAWTDRAEI